MRSVSGFSNTARFGSRGTVVQRATGGSSPEPAPTQARTRQKVDLEELVERVYQRWQDEIRRERERGGW